MTFDKSKVYTALNADEVKIGSKGFFADTLAHLQMLVNKYDVDDIEELTLIDGTGTQYRFCSGNVYSEHALFYLVEEAPKKHIVPFDSTQELKMHFIQKFDVKCAPSGCELFVWVKQKTCNSAMLITAFTDTGACVDCTWYTLQELYDEYTFLDGTLIGKEL